MRRRLRWEELTGEDLGTLSRDTPVILPVGSVEYHGPHLPLGVDAMVVYEVALRAAEMEPAVVLPPLFYGYAPSARAWLGTISLSAETFVRVLEEVCDEVHRNGFKKIIILNGHGGNRRPIRLFLREVLAKGKPYAVYAMVDPWAPISQVIERVAETKPVGHACEVETSMALYLFPKLCRMDRAAPAEVGREGLVPGAETPVDWANYARKGYVGRPDRADQEKGRVLVERWAREVARVIRLVREDTRYWELVKMYAGPRT
ncbi:MAG: hypothetical protein DRO06_03660 [Thermoproteota archaeon]|nr:MAG: hypothetical protein DRO06_03660 [Candidatus Korarchaeota archaeon]